MVRILVHALLMYEVSNLTARPRVTVVNDSPEFLELMGDVLAERYQPTLIDASHPDVLGAIRRSQPSLLLLGIGPPDERLGPGGARTIAQQPEFRSLPVLLCSAGLSPDPAEAVSSPPVGVLKMPFRLDHLTAELDRLLVADPPRDRSASASTPTTHPFATGY